MKRIFKSMNLLRAPDGTLSSPFLNSKNSMSSFPPNILDGFSMAAGVIEAGTTSKIQIMSYVTQVIFVRRGQLKIYMKGPQDPDSYFLSVEQDEAVLAEPGTFFQLINESIKPCEVLYIVSPAYLVEMGQKRVIYDDSVVLNEDWVKLKESNWQPAVKIPTAVQRQEAERRLSERPSPDEVLAAAKQILQDRAGADFYENKEILAQYLEGVLHIEHGEAAEIARQIDEDRRGANFYGDGDISLLAQVLTPRSRA
jgi:mannose-6-phosphate isomerase-like protein (cupin superfamily)